MINLNHFKMYDLLYNKSIVLVGGKENFKPDETLLHCADFVVRINQHVLWQGGRCDGLYCSTADPCELRQLDHPPLFLGYRVSGLYQDSFRDYARENRCIPILFQNERYGKVNPIGVECEWSNIFGHMIGCKPFTGTLAIHHLCSFPIKALHLTGFDMHIHTCEIKQTLEGHSILKRGPHEIAPQVRWLRKYAQCDKRLTMDDTLKEALYNG